MAKAVHRSAITGHFVRRSTVARHPKTTITQSVPSRGGGRQHRSTITGRFIGPAPAARHPRTSIKEG